MKCSSNSYVSAALWTLLAVGGLQSVAQSQDRAMSRGDAQRSRVLLTVGPEQVPQTLLWKSAKLFHLHEYYFTEKLENGPFKMTVDIPTGYDFTFPIISGGVIFFTVEVRMAYFYAIDARTGKQLVLLEFDGNRLSPPAAIGRIGFFGTVTGRVYAYDVDKQSVKWTFNEPDGRSFAASSPAVDGGIVYFCASGGGVFAFVAETGELTWNFRTKDYFYGPALKDDHVILLNPRGSLISLNKKTGTKRWEAQIPRDNLAPSILGSQIISVHTRGEIRAYSLGDGSLKWKTKKYGGANGFPALLNETVFFGGRKNSIVALHAATGLEKWRFETKLPCDSPIIAGDIVYTSCTDKKLYALDAETGREKWRYDNRKAVPPTPTFANGIMYTLGSDGLLYAFK